MDRLIALFVSTLALWLVLFISFDRSPIHPSILVFAVCGVFGWLYGVQLGRREPRTIAAEGVARIRQVPMLGTCGAETPNRQQLLKAALANLGNTDALNRSPLTRLPALSTRGASGNELGELLVELVTELTVSGLPRDREAGRLLFDYYVKRVGSHEVVMERLCLSRPTFYRRLNRGIDLVAGRLAMSNEVGRRAVEAVA